MSKSRSRLGAAVLALGLIGGGSVVAAAPANAIAYGTFASSSYTQQPSQVACVQKKNQHASIKYGGRTYLAANKCSYDSSKGKWMHYIEFRYRY